MEDVIERLCQNCADLSNNLNMLVVMLREQNKDTAKLVAIRELLNFEVIEKKNQNDKGDCDEQTGEEMLREFREKAIHDDEVEEPRIESAKERKTRLMNEYDARRKALAKKREKQFDKGKKKRDPKVVYIRDDVVLEDDWGRIDYTAPIDIFAKPQQSRKHETQDVSQDEADEMLENYRNEEADKCGRVPLKRANFKSGK